MKKTFLAISCALVMVLMSIVPAFAATVKCPNGHGPNCHVCVSSPEATCPKPQSKPPVINVIIDDSVTSPKTGEETSFVPYIILLMSVATCGLAVTKLKKTSK